MGLLKKHQKSKYRWSCEDIVFYHPTDTQYESLKNIITKNATINIEEGVAEGNFGINIIREVIREMTNIGSEVDEYDDAEFEALIEGGNRTLKLLMDEVVAFIEEILEDSSKDVIKQLKYFNDMLNAISFNEDAEKSKAKFDKFSKKYKLGVTFDDIVHMTNDKNALIEKINKGIN